MTIINDNTKLNYLAPKQGRPKAEDRRYKTGETLNQALSKFYK